MFTIIENITYIFIFSRTFKRKDSVLYYNGTIFPETERFYNE